jgi:hypothetical protein
MRVLNIIAIKGDQNSAKISRINWVQCSGKSNYAVMAEFSTESFK